MVHRKRNIQVLSQGATARICLLLLAEIGLCSPQPALFCFVSPPRPAFLCPYLPCNGPVTTAEHCGTDNQIAPPCWQCPDFFWAVLLWNADSRKSPVWGENGCLDIWQLTTCARVWLFEVACCCSSAISLWFAQLAVLGLVAPFPFTCSFRFFVVQRSCTYHSGSPNWVCDGLILWAVPRLCLNFLAAGNRESGGPLWCPAFGRPQVVLESLGS